MYTRPVGHGIKPISAARERLVVSDSVSSFTVPSSAIEGRSRLETAQIRFTLDGSDPSATVGQILDIGDRLNFDNRGEITALKGIRTGVTNGVLDIEYLTADI